MAIDQIIKQDNGDGSTTVTVTTTGGGCATSTYYDYQSQSTQDNIINDTVKSAIDDE